MIENFIKKIKETTLDERVAGIITGIIFVVYLVLKIGIGLTFIKTFLCTVIIAEIFWLLMVMRRLLKFSLLNLWFRINKKEIFEELSCKLQFTKGEKENNPFNKTKGLLEIWKSSRGEYKLNSEEEKKIRAANTKVKIVNILAKKLGLEGEDESTLKEGKAEDVSEIIKTKLSLNDEEKEKFKTVWTELDDFLSKKIKPKTFQHYEISLEFLENDETCSTARLKFADKYLLKWKDIRTQISTIVGFSITVAGVISAGGSVLINIVDWFSENGLTNISWFPNCIEKMKEILEALPMGIELSKEALQDLNLLGGEIIIAIVFIMLESLTWKLNDDKFYHQIIKDILDKKSEDRNAE